MAALSAVVFTLSGWLGLYLLARDPRKPVLVLAAIGLGGFALVVALDAVRTVSVTHTQLLSQVEIYLAAVPSVAWFAVLVELSRPCDSWRTRTRELLLVAGVAALTLFGAMLAGSVNGPLRTGHWLMFAVISVSTLGAMIVAVLRPAQPRPVAGVVVVTMSRLIGELFGRRRLDYDYQPAVPILDAVLHMKHYGLDKPTALGFRVPDPFFLPSLGMVREWRRQGYANYFRFSLR